jgi:hydrogenase maturation protease
MGTDTFRRTVIGVGNPYRGDDGVGVLVARRLRDAGIEDVTVMEQDGEAAALIEALKEMDMAVLIDAAQGANPGAIHRFDAASGKLPSHMFSWSTHDMGYAIEGESFEAGAPLSPPVEAAAAEVERRVREEFLPASGASNRS